MPTAEFVIFSLLIPFAVLYPMSYRAAVARGDRVPFEHPRVLYIATVAAFAICIHMIFLTDFVGTIRQMFGS